MDLAERMEEPFLLERVAVVPINAELDWVAVLGMCGRLQVPGNA